MSLTSTLVTTRPEVEGGHVRGGLAVLAVALFFTNLDSYTFALSMGPPPVRYLMGYIAVAALLAILEPTRPFEILRSPFGLWLFAYFFVTTLWAPWIKAQPQLIQEIYDRFRSIACLLGFAIIFDHPRARRAALLAVAVAVAAAAVLNLAEAASIFTFVDSENQRVAGRAAGFYFNANTSALAIIAGLAVSIEAVPKNLRVPLLLLAGFGVAATFSRGGMICLAVLFVWLVWRRALGKGQLVVTTVAIVLLATYALAYLHAHDLLNENTASRLELQKDDSGRIALMMKAWDLFASAPWFGQGLGSTIAWDEPVRAHNMYLTWAADHGVVGLLLYPALAFALVRSNGAAAGLALVLLAAGFFTHGALEDRYWLVLLALAAANPARTSAGRPGAGETIELRRPAAAQP